MGAVRPASDKASEAGSPLARTLRLLLIEDSETDAELIEHEIRRGGFELVTTRVTTAAAMRVELRSHTFDLIISDHHLPGSGSEETLAVLHEAELDIPYLIVSGAIGEEAAVAAM